MPPPPLILYHHCHNHYCAPSTNTSTTTTSTKNTLKYSNPTIFGLATLITAVSTTTSTPPPPLHHHHYKYHQPKQHYNIITNKTNHWCKINRGKKPYSYFLTVLIKPCLSSEKGFLDHKVNVQCHDFFLLNSYRLFRQNGLFLVLVLGLGGAERRFSL